jgi:uncharacterized membrane protein YoaK (UPF0700 family)
MARSDPPPLSAGRAAIAVALTAVAGFVDALSWLALDRVFTAQMSGNTVLVAVHAAAGERGQALLHVYTIGMFLFGLLISGIVIELGLRWRLRRLLAAAMALEAALLAVFAIWGHPLLNPAGGATPGWAVYLLVAVASLAMGVQNTSLRMAGVLGVYTTHVTGTLTRLSEDLVVFGFGLADRLAARQRTFASEELRRRGPAALGKLGLSAGLFVGFLIGAGLAAYLVPQWGYTAALALPIATVVVIGIVDAIWPLGEGRRTHQQNA